MMKLPKRFVSFFLFVMLLVGHNIGRVRATSRFEGRSQKTTNDTFQAKKLFVFGDSYADTGNSGDEAPSWNQPYGITYPGQPAGRYSDGRLLADYVANFYGLKTPTAYRFTNTTPEPEQLRYGANFALGGTGVFDTGIGYANMTVQIGYLKQYLNDSVLNTTDLETSLCLLSVNGNDYVAYLRNNGTKGLLAFIRSVVNQIAKDMKSLHDLGARKIAVTAMPPSGCIPYFAQSSKQCNELVNLGSYFHNFLLNATVSNLTSESGDSSYFILDLYSAFETVFNSGVFPTPYEACCLGISSNYTCGSVNDQGQPMYSVCNNPNFAFYWDLVHPTQAGWNATYELALKDALGQIMN